MGNNEGGTPPKSDKASSPMQEQSSVPSYPDWTAFQAYYPGVSIPPPYFGSAVASGHTPPPYIWPQPLMPHYGTSYTTIYSHGGVYAHHPMSLGSHPHGHGITSPAPTSEVAMQTSLSIETPGKQSSSKDRGLMKKLKGFDGLAVSIGNSNVENTPGGAVRGLSPSADCGTEGSSDRSDESTAQEGNHMQRKRTSVGMTAIGKDGKVDTQAHTVRNGVANASFIRPFGATGAPQSVAGKPAGSIPASSMTPGMEFRGPTTAKAMATAAAIVPATSAVGAGRNGLSTELWIPDERELKRERRKQSNRESARRSRLRKQAESEELAMKVESLSSENLALRSEINRLTENSEKLRLENSTLMGRLRNAQLERKVVVPDKAEPRAAPSIENFLSRVNNPSLISRTSQRDGESNDNSGKLHQLLETNTRADALAAG